MTAIDGCGLFRDPPGLGAAGEQPFRRLEVTADRSRLIAPVLSLLFHSAAIAALAASVGVVGIDGEGPEIDAVEVSLVAPPAPIAPSPAAPVAPADVALAAPDALETTPPEVTAQPTASADAATAPEPAGDVATLPPPSEPPPEARPDALDPAAPVEMAPAPAASAPPITIERRVAIPPPAKPRAARAPVAPKAPTMTPPAAATRRPPQTAASGGADRSPSVQSAAARGDGERDALARYLAAVRARIVSQRRAPLGGDRGRVEVRFTIGRDGSLDGIRASGGAGDLLEGEALRIVRRASPVAPIPAEVGRTALATTVTIDFR